MFGVDPGTLVTIALALAAAGAVTGGPAPFSPRDRSAFLSALDLVLVRLKRKGFVAGSPDTA